MTQLEQNRALHCAAVAKYMYEHAAERKLPPAEMYIVGLLHDIGYMQNKEAHEEYCANLVTELGISIAYVDAIRYHGRDLYELQAENPDAITPELILLVEADCKVDAYGNEVGYVGRLADIIRRYANDKFQINMTANNSRFVEEYKTTHYV